MRVLLTVYKEWPDKETRDLAYETMEEMDLLCPEQVRTLVYVNVDQIGIVDLDAEDRSRRSLRLSQVFDDGSTPKTTTWKVADVVKFEVLL